VSAAKALAGDPEYNENPDIAPKPTASLS